MAYELENIRITCGIYSVFVIGMLVAQPNRTYKWLRMSFIPSVMPIRFLLLKWMDCINRLVCLCFNLLWQMLIICFANQVLVLCFYKSFLPSKIFRLISTQLWISRSFLCERLLMLISLLNSSNQSAMLIKITYFATWHRINADSAYWSGGS